MVRSERNFRNGWVISILFHGALAIALMFLTVRQYVPEPHFVEMSWGMVSTTDIPIPEIPATKQSSSSNMQKQKTTDNSVDLPTRKYLDLPDEVISLRARKKNITADNPAALPRGGKIAAREYQSSTSPNDAGERNTAAGKAPSSSNVNVATPFTTGGSGGGIGNSPEFKIQWTGGGIRDLLVGDMPVYPPGVNVQAQIRLKVTVRPDGSVRSVQPAQKGDTRLENAAINKVKLWQFEPLFNSQPQVDQKCDITFNFELK